MVSFFKYVFSKKGKLCKGGGALSNIQGMILIKEMRYFYQLPSQVCKIDVTLEKVSIHLISSS